LKRKSVKELKPNNSIRAASAEKQLNNSMDMSGRE
jgi:hypothetical protein